MTDCSETDVEILVHISAPSGAKDDGRYRRQAEACLGFEPARRHIILQPDRGHVVAEAAAALGGTARETLSVESHGARPAPDQEQQGHTGIVLCAVTPSLKRPSEQTRPQTAPSAATPLFTSTRALRRTQSDSWGTPPSVVPDSQPLVQPVASGSSKSPVHHRQSPQPFLGEPPSKRQRRLEPTAVVPPTVPSSTAHASPIRTDLDRASVASPQLPSTLSPSDRLQTNRLQTKLSRPASSTTPTPQTQIPSSKRQQQQQQQQPPPPPSSPSSPPPRSPNLHLHLHPQTLTIQPPPPPTTSTPFKTHLTPSLALLAKHADLTKRYQPAHTTRPLRSLERGHWVLDCTDFPPHQRSKMWEFLAGFVGGGRAGWGVWCEFVGSGVRGVEAEAEAGVQDVCGEEGRGDGGHGDEGGGEGSSRRRGALKGKGTGTGRGKVILKIYCWGEIVPHVYIVLFLATSRMVKGAGARWVDGSGDVVVQMP